jgi:hypothetical protein
MEGRLALNDTDLRAHIPGAPLMFLDDIDATHHYPIQIGITYCQRATTGSSLRQHTLPNDHTLDLTTCSLVIPTDHFDCIATFDIHNLLP